MPLPSLPDECIVGIFSFLDRKFLYKCLFINRHYCKISIPIIWREPFRSNHMKPLLINTLLSCLNEDEISSLIPCEINFNNDQSPLFEYGKFIRKICHEHCVEHIINWLKLLASRSVINQDCRVQKLVNAIYHMIMRQGSNLQAFDVGVDLLHSDLPKFLITYNSGFTNLKSISVNFRIESNIKYRQNTIDFLSTIPKFCKSIVNCKLWIHKLSSTFVESFLDIVRLLPLERIIIHADNHVEKENVKKIIYTLEFRSETLKALLFRHQDLQGIDLSFISKLKCLERLKFECCKGFVSEHYKDLSKKLHLNGLKLWHDECEFYDNISKLFIGFDMTLLNVMKTMINSLCGETLLKLSLNIITFETVKAVKESCPNINLLQIKIHSEKFFDSIIPLISDLSSLKVLHIQTDILIYDTSLLVQILGDYLISVECLWLEFYVDLQSFEYFTKHCKANLRKFGISINKPLRKYYLTRVNNYQKVHNSLRIFQIYEIDETDEYDKYDGLGWTNEELEIIDSLDNNGVNVVILQTD